MSRTKAEITNKILDNIKKARGYDSDADISLAWGRNSSTISTWRKNGNLSLEPLVEYESDLNFNYLFFDDLPERRKEIRKDGKVVMLHEPGELYGEKSMTERIQDLDLPANEKLDLLKAYIKVLEELKSTEPDE